MPAGSTTECSSGDGADGCNTQSTEHHANFTLHVVEFDDEGWPLEGRSGSTGGQASTQLDSAISQIKGELGDTSHCVQLFVYVHGWQHNAWGEDDDVKHFRHFLDSVAKRSGAKADTRCPSGGLARSRYLTRKWRQNRTAMVAPTGGGQNTHCRIGGARGEPALTDDGRMFSTAAARDARAAGSARWKIRN